ncbi:MAG TPA: alkaline phosphatase D family protein [Allosphingosinicella sp.]|jgi:alkaline phosphatase D
MTLSRRAFLEAAAAMGASLAWAGPVRASRTKWQERRDLYPEGVASGDPAPDSVILWTRRPFETGEREILTVELAEDEAFRHVVARAPAPVSAAADWTCRVLVGGLRPAHTYWYRFADAEGNGSRIGRTITAPAANDPRPVSFAFVSCQDLNEGKLNGYRRMIFEDERAPAAERLGFVLHLGDFIYEVVQYPEEQKTRYDRTIYEVARISDGGTVGKFHYPLTLGGYRAIYKGYLADPDLQDARARWPFVAIWDNHEFSWQGRQSIVQAGGPPQPGQTVKVAANQAWFEYIPARVRAPSGSLAEFGPPPVENVKIENWDEYGLGQEPNNLTAIRSLIAYRGLRYGRHLDLFLTDQHSFCGEDPTDDVDGIEKIFDPAFNGMFSEEATIALDAGRAYDGGKPPAELHFREARIANPRKDKAPRTILGVEQKRWFKDRLRQSKATWKIWGNSLGALDIRVDPQNLPAGLVDKPWPTDTYAILRTDDYGAAYAERREIYDLVRDSKITGFAIVSGDRHSFWAGYASASLPPRKFEPVGLSFVGGSLISPGAMEGFEHGFKKPNPLKPLYLATRPGAPKPEWTYNMTLLHGVRSSLEYARSFDLGRAKALRNPDLAPHLEFFDAGGHGYAKVRLTGREMRTEFVCIPRPIARSGTPDGGPLRYRVVHTARLWRPGEVPRLERKVLEGDPGLSI